MRESWTDERLDDLNAKVDRGFAENRDEFVKVRTEMKDEFASVRAEMRAGFERVDQRFERIDEQFDRIDARFEALHRLMVQFCGLIVAALIGVIATQL